MSTQANPSDARGGTGPIQLADAAQALAETRGRAHAIASESMERARRFQELETLRASAVAASASSRALYLGKPVPLEASERSCWENAVGLWQAFYFGYALCADAGMEQAEAATVAQRALDSLGRAIREHVYAYRAVPPSLWKELNSCYRSAVECALADTAVADAQAPHARSHCTGAYLGTILHDAANQYALAGAQMMLLGAWLPGFVDLVELRETMPAAPERSPLALDIAGDRGATLARSLAPAPSVRHLDTTRLGARLRELADCLRSRAQAPELERAGELPRSAVERLLTHLYVQWCSAGSGRMDEREGTGTRAHVGIGMHAAHFQISGRAFRQPGSRYTREEERDLATFGHITERTEQRLLTGRSAALEPWEIVNRSVSGALGLLRKADQDRPIAIGQLVAMRMNSIDPPGLGVIQRLKWDADGAVSVGLRLVRGEARGVAVRPAGATAQAYERALLIDADGDQATLIAGVGRFAAGSSIELHSGRAEQVRLEQLVERNADFDRYTVTRL